MDIQIKAEAKMEPKDYLELTHFMTYDRSLLSPVFNTILLICVFLAFFADIAVERRLTVKSAVAAAVLLLVYALPEYQARKFGRTDSSFIRHVFSYLFDEKGLTVYDQTASTVSFYAWESIMNLYETKDYFFVLMNKQNAITVPKRAFTPEDLADLAETFRFKLGKRYDVRMMTLERKKRKKGKKPSA